MKKFYALLLIIFFTATNITAQNTALLLDGNSEHLTIPHKNAFEIVDHFTIEAWIFANSWTTEIWRGSIFNNDTQGPDRGYAFRCGDNGKLSFVMAVDNVWNDINSPSLMNTNQWHHIAVVISDGTMRLFIDGQQVAAGTYSGTPTPNELPQNIGASPGFGGRFFDGVIDEVRIWNTARTANEIADNTTTDFTGTESGLVAYFPMNDGMGTTVENLADSNCSATGVDTDDTNWVDGYQLPDHDLSMQSIAGIDRVNMKTRPVKMAVVIQNTGLETVSDFDVQIAVDGNTLLTETVPLSLAAGEQIEFTLTTPLDLTSSSNPEIEATLIHPQDENTLNNSTSISLNTIGGNFVRLFDSEQHNFGAQGQHQNANIMLPANLSGYQQLLLHISVDCPSSGCDPWDQPAKVIAHTDQGSFEIARYITPFGIGCGAWTVDVTDFKSILQGAVIYNSFIQVWGLSGWLATIDLELIEGNDPLPFSKISSLWSLDYLVYGDPGISHDVTPASVTVDNITEYSHVRMQVTGHGQGNTNNAAEFYNVTHGFHINGSEVDQHHLWKNDCASNTCSDQAGTWLFSRAGWCPGQEVQSKIFVTTNEVSPGSQPSFDYVLQDYVNLLNTGYNDSGHTEPHLRLHGFFVEKSSQPYTSYTNLLVDAITPTVVDNELQSVEITVTNDGSETINNFEFRYFINNEIIATVPISQSLAPGSSYTHSFMELGNLVAGQNIFFGEVLLSSDENPGDNVAKEEVNITVSTSAVEILKAFNIQPNPSSQTIYVTFSENLLNGQLMLLSLEGKLIQSQNIIAQKQQLVVNHPGTYLLKVADKNGYSATKKVIVIE